MALFLTLCLLSRLAYSLNDILTGRLARHYGRIEVAAWRGVALGVLMAPFLFWVPRGAWSALAQQWPELLLVVSLTGALNILQLHAARLLPFGVRAAFILSGVALGGMFLGWLVLDERLSFVEAGLGLLVIGSAITGALGTHADHEIEPKIAKGAVFAVAAAVLMALVALMVARLARSTHPLLTAWAWEFGAGAILVVPMLAAMRGSAQRLSLARFGRIAIAASPTVVGSGASAIALVQGALGVWAAVAGTQVLFTAALGALWHHERVGPVRWVCFAVAAGAVGILALVGR